MPTRKKKASGKRPKGIAEWSTGWALEAIIKRPIIEEPDSDDELEPKQEAPEPRHVRRNSVSLEVATDDEADTETVTLTYPRPRLARAISPPPPSSEHIESVFKQVRFEERPLKSALKKTRVTTFQPDSASDVSSGSKFDTEDLNDALEFIKYKKKLRRSAHPGESQSESNPKSNKKNGKKGKVTDSEASESEVSESEAESPPKSVKKSSNKQVKKPTQSKNDTDTDASKSESEKSPQKSKKKGAKNTETDETTSESDNASKSKNNVNKSKASNKKGGKKVEKSETDDTSDSSNSDEDVKSKQKKKAAQNKKQQQKETKSSKKKAKKQDTDSSDEASSDDEPKRKDKKGKQKRKKGQENDYDLPQSQYSDIKILGPQSYHPPYPNGWPKASPRSPNLIEPIRAHVVQTERVVERPQDPAPNAFYDGQNNVLRVYHGPVYGNPHQNSLYQRRNSRGNSSRPPINLGQPHPTENPYFQGWQSVPQQPGYSYVPITQGMPPQVMAPQGAPPAFWNPMYPPPGPLPGYYEKEAPPVAASSKDKDRPGTNNVGPANTASNNPYRVQSQFSVYGSNGQRNNSRNTRNGQRNTSNNTQKSVVRSNNNDWSNNNGPNNNNSNAWNTDWNDGTSAPPENDTWGTTNGPVDDTWGANNEQPESNNFNQSRSRSSRDRVNGWGVAAPWSTHGDDVETTFATNGGNTPVDPNFNPGTTFGPENNVMPGTWVETPNVNPPWGDPTAAADTNGQAADW